MRRNAVAAAMIFTFTASTALAQQAGLPTPLKPVHPTPIPATGCRGCTDAVTDKSTAVKAYDEKTDSTSKKTPPPARKVKAKKHTAKRSAPKPKTSSKAAATKRAKAAAQKKPIFRDRPAVLDPLIGPHTASTTKAKADTAKK